MKKKKLFPFFGSSSWLLYHVLSRSIHHHSRCRPLSFCPLILPPSVEGPSRSVGSRLTPRFFVLFLFCPITQLTGARVLRALEILFLFCCVCFLQLPKPVVWAYLLLWMSAVYQSINEEVFLLDEFKLGNDAFSTVTKLVFILQVLLLRANRNI